MFFDLHTDILYDIVKKRLRGQKNIIKDFHLPQLLKGHINGGIWTYYTDVNDIPCEFDQALEFIFDELNSSRDYINIVKKAKDFTNNKINVVLGFESLYNVKDLDELNEMYQLGFRHAMLTWNEENHFSTGVRGDALRGLTELGKEAVKFMNEHNMIVDVSHTNLKSFNDILEVSTKPVIASHSNINTLCNHPRNLTDEQINKIVCNNGIIGITAVKSFINKEQPTVENMVKHITYLKDKGLINNIAVGFDFMDYLHESFNTSNLIDLTKATETKNLLNAFTKASYAKDEIDKISNLNAINLVKSILM